MATIECRFKSEVLQLSTAMTVVVPDEALTRKPERLATLYLLHGMSDDHSTWTRLTSIERHAADFRLAVVMPAVHRSFYTDMSCGGNYWRHVSEEVPRVARALFPLSDRREHTFAAGNSMGGYGAFKLALRLPERFAAAASLSGLLDVAERAREWDPVRHAEMEWIFGPVDRVSGSDNDLVHLAEREAARRGEKPALYMWCGTEDGLYRNNLSFRDKAAAAGLRITYEESAGGHQWSQWDRWIQRVLEWLPLKKW